MWRFPLKDLLPDSSEPQTDPGGLDWTRPLEIYKKLLMVRDLGGTLKVDIMSNHKWLL